jgi:hypothetical protein
MQRRHWAGSALSQTGTSTRSRDHGADPNKFAYIEREFDTEGASMVRPATHKTGGVLRVFHVTGRQPPVMLIRHQAGTETCQV